VQPAPDEAAGERTSSSFEALEIDWDAVFADIREQPSLSRSPRAQRARRGLTEHFA
jgi:hypothetical protein